MWERPEAVRAEPLDGSALCAAHAQPLLSPALPGREAPQHLQALSRGTAREAWDKRYCQYPA